MKYCKDIIQKINEYCLNEPGAYEARPFGPEPHCYKVMGKIFAQLNNDEDFFRLTLKCGPEQGYIYRQFYPGIVVRGYHCPPVQQPYWNTIDLDRFNDLNKVFNMIDEAYDAVISKLPRKNKSQLEYLADMEFEYSDHVIFAMNNGAKAGSAEFSPYDDEHIRIISINVENGFQERGIGSELVRRLEAIAKMEGYKWSRAEIDTDSTSLQHMLARTGYKLSQEYNTNDRKYMIKKI